MTKPMRKNLITFGAAFLIIGLILIGYAITVTSLPSLTPRPTTKTLEDTYTTGYIETSFYAGEGDRINIKIGTYTEPYNYTPFQNTTYFYLMDSNNYHNWQFGTGSVYLIANTTIPPNHTLTATFNPSKDDHYYIILDPAEQTIAHLEIKETTMTLQLLWTKQNNTAPLALGVFLFLIGSIMTIIGILGIRFRKPKKPPEYQNFEPYKWEPR